MQSSALAFLVVITCHSSAASTKATVHYLGVGSNVDQSVMERRIGSKPLSAEPACAPDHRLAFTAIGTWPEPAFASVEPSPYAGQECHGVLYTLSLSQMARLCVSEMVPAGYSLLPVRCETYAGERVGAFALNANGPGRALEAIAGPIRPSRRYLELIREGARKSGLAPSWLDRLAKLQPAPGT
mmetsp:Transcript_4889/g.13470  ORF Transcript_4889/g.13470 Transcript_4889/m.13470 type:complete len:184 (+) Transcript_4889:59-610(+)